MTKEVQAAQTWVCKARSLLLPVALKRRTWQLVQWPSRVVLKEPPW